MWHLARSVGLDVNSPYAYVLWGDRFAATSNVAVEPDGEIVGFVTGFRPPDDPAALFVWQIGVVGHSRGRGVARQMLDDLLARTAPSWLEATVTPSNTASASLFRGVATRRGVGFHEVEAYTADLFPGDHEAEVRLRIGPLDRRPNESASHSTP